MNQQANQTDSVTKKRASRLAKLSEETIRNKTSIGNTPLHTAAKFQVAFSSSSCSWKASTTAASRIGTMKPTVHNFVAYATKFGAWCFGSWRAPTVSKIAHWDHEPERTGARHSCR